MYISQLKVFVEVAETLSFSEAASRLNISQSVVSQNIAKLEKLSGTLLVIRNKRPLGLRLQERYFFRALTISSGNQKKQ